MKLVTKEVDPHKVEMFGQEVIIDEAGVNLTVVYHQVIYFIGCVREKFIVVNFVHVLFCS